MAVGMIVDQSLAQPENTVKAEGASQSIFDFVLCKLRISVGIEQALFGRYDQPRTVSVDRTAFQDPVRDLERQAGIRSQFCADRLIAFH